MDGTNNDLVSLGELGAGADLGLTGRPVFAGDGTLLGTVADVLGDARGDGPRFVAVMLEPAVARMQGGRRVYVPFAGARVDGERVYLDAVTGETAATLPEQPGGMAAAAATPLDRARAADDDATRLLTGDEALPPVPGTTPPPLPGGGVHELVGDSERLVLSEEELHVGKREVAAGEVTIHKHVEEQVIRQPVSVMREHVDVERRPVPPGAGLEPRTEDGVMYIPIVEEELVITKRLVAREELVIRKSQVTEQQMIEETVRRERAEITGPGTAGEQFRER
jgi:uncharacterized protein (TIGR02271 family)